MSELSNIVKKLKSSINHDIEATEVLGAIRLEGKAGSWDDVVAAGKIAAKGSWRGVINDITAAGIDNRAERQAKINDTKLDGFKTDVLIIGGGIIGCSIARELSRYQVKLLLIDKDSDIGLHQSSRNGASGGYAKARNKKSLL